MKKDLKKKMIPCLLIRVSGVRVSDRSPRKRAAGNTWWLFSFLSRNRMMKGFLEGRLCNLRQDACIHIDIRKILDDVLTTVVTGCRNKNRSDMKKSRPCRAAFLLKIEKEKCFYKLIHSKLPVEMQITVIW